MTPEQAIHIVAMQLVANAAREIQWEDSPEVGEHDWRRIAEDCMDLTPEPERFDDAVTLLEARADTAVKEDT